jgi:hypothetical protein
MSNDGIQVSGGNLNVDGALAVGRGARATSTVAPDRQIPAERPPADAPAPARDADVFVSYTAADRPWAEWIAWQLEEAGFQTVLQAWDIGAGRDWVHEMQQAASRARRTLAVLSESYLRSAHGGAEWRAAYALDPSGEQQRLVPVRIDACEPPGLLRTRVYVDLLGLGEAAARERLIAAFAAVGERAKPSLAPAFPESRVAFPGRP